MSTSHARLVQELSPVVRATGADLEDVTVTRAGRRSVVRVVVDKGGGITLDEVAVVSAALSEALDELDAREPALIAGAYVLEVSSPGVDRSLTAPRHWQRSTGRLVTAQLRVGEPVTGRLLCADDSVDGGVIVDVAGTECSLAYGEVVHGQVQVEFSRVGPDEEERP